MKDKQQKKRMYRVLAGYAHGGQDEPHGLGGDREELVGDVEAQMSPLQRWLPQEETTNSLRALSTHEMYCPQEGDRFFSAELVREGLAGSWADRGPSRPLHVPASDAEQDVLAELAR